MAGYGNDTGLNSWLADNGYSLPGGSPAVAVLRQRGSAYIDGVYGPRFSGTPTGGFAQERAWPRTGAEAYGAAIDDDVIPDAVVQASYAAALYESENPGGLTVAVTPGQAVKREKVGSLEVEYQSSSGNAVADSMPLLTAAEGLLAPFLTTFEPVVLVV